MVSLELTVGPWALSFSLGRAEETTTLRVVSLSDLSEVAEDPEDEPEASFGFSLGHKRPKKPKVMRPLPTR